MAEKTYILTESQIKQIKVDAIDKLIEEIMKRPLVNYFQICEIVQIGKQLKEQNNETKSIRNE